MQAARCAPSIYMHTVGTFPAIYESTLLVHIQSHMHRAYWYERDEITTAKCQRLYCRVSDLYYAGTQERGSYLTKNILEDVSCLIR